MTRGLAVFIALLVLSSVLSLWQTDRWWVRALDFPRLQIAALLLIALALLLGLGARTGPTFWAAIVAGLAALAWQISHFAAYLPLMHKQVESVGDCAPGRSLSLLNFNVLEDNRRYAELLLLVERVDPDVLLLLETDAAWAEAMAPLERTYPHRLAEPLPNTYGMMLFSKLPFEGKIVHRMQQGIPSIRARLTLESGETIVFHGVHPEPPLPGKDTGERDAELVLVGREVRDDGGAALVLGDLNDVAWSRTSRLFRNVSGMLDPRAGRGLYPTYHADYRIARWPLDHLFVTPHFRIMEINRLGDIGSDHFPIFYQVCLTADPDRRLTPRTPPAEVRQDSREEVRKGLEERAEDSEAK